MDWGALFGMLGPFASGASRGQLSDEQWKALFQLAMDRQALDRQRYGDTAPATRLRTAVQGSNVAHAAPTQITWGGRGSGKSGQLPDITGGVHDQLASMSPEARALGTLAGKDALAAQQQGGITGGNRDRAMPKIEDPGSSWWDKLLGGLGMGSNLLGILGKAGMFGGGGSPGGSTDYGPNYGPDYMGPDYGPPTPPTDLGGVDPNMLPGYGGIPQPGDPSEE